MEDTANTPVFENPNPAPAPAPEQAAAPAAPVPPPPKRAAPARKPPAAPEQVFNAPPVPEQAVPEQAAAPERTLGELGVSLTPPAAPPPVIAAPKGKTPRVVLTTTEEAPDYVPGAAPVEETRPLSEKTLAEMEAGRRAIARHQGR